MSLTAADVAEIMRLVEQSVFDELTLEFDGMKLSLRRGGARPSSEIAVAPVIAGAPVTATTLATVPRDAPAARMPAKPDAPDLQEVVAPMLGTFYCAPKPGADPFVRVGSVVTEDTVVAIIEVMKLMNSVRAGVRGTVTDIIGRDGSLVEFGEPLLRVRKAAP
jgi:acetyl-CoA carboxylase biotin carboxyl carrier protein